MSIDVEPQLPKPEPKDQSGGPDRHLILEAILKTGRERWGGMEWTTPGNGPKDVGIDGLPEMP